MFKKSKTKTKDQSNSQPRPKAKGWRVSNKKFFMVLSLIVLIVLGLSVWWSIYTFGVVKKAQQDVQTQTTSEEIQSDSAKKEAQQIVAEVGKLMVLPEGEDPLLATVVNADSLRAKNKFYADASDGDKVLVYPLAGKAILYSPSKNRVINTGPVNLDE